MSDDTSQKQLRKSDLFSGEHAGYSFPYQVEGVVVKVYYPPQDPSNPQPGESILNQLEYDVDVTSVPQMPRLQHVPCLASMAGLEDGDDNVLQAASVDVTGGSSLSLDGGQGNKPTLRHSTDGDRVLVAFINGNVQRPVITGVLTHTKNGAKPNTRGWKDITGKQLPEGGQKIRRMRHRGTEVVADDSGNVTVNFGQHPDSSAPGGAAPVGTKKKFSFTIGDFVITVDNTSGPPATMKIVNQAGTSVQIQGATIQFDNGTTPVAKEGSSITGHSHFVVGMAGAFPIVLTPTDSSPPGYTNQATDTVKTGTGSQNVQVP